jgi:hypothetical protein
MHTRFWWGLLKERSHLGISGMDGKILLKRVFKNWDGGMD